MITEEEKDEIINLTTERVLLKLPEVVGNLMANHVALMKINSKFYSDYPEFRDVKDVVAKVVESIEGKNPLDDYESLLKKAVPEIRKRIKTFDKLDMKRTDRPKLDFHGEI